MRVLVNGGAGFIGSHTVLALQEAGHECLVLDDLSTGVAALVPPGAPLKVGQVGDETFLSGVLVTLLYSLKNRDQKRGLATLCIGGGMGAAMLVERV